LRFSKTALNIVKLSFLLSVVYNIMGVGWAASGQLSPVVAAIFMPLSTLSVVFFSVGLTWLLARYNKLI
jgi:Cu+-exporting ATPase